MKSGIKAFQLDNQEGYFYQQQTMWEKYLRRPRSLEDICYAQFAKCYKSLPMSQGKKEDEVDEDINEPSEDDEDDANVDDEKGSKFDYVMRNDGKPGKPLPSTITLMYPQPGECPMMRKRRKPCALRFHKVKESNDPIGFMLSEVMLYRPLRDEVSRDDVLTLYKEKHDDILKVEIVKSQVMEFLESVSEARFYAEEALKELDLELAGEVMDAEGEQDNEDCQEEGLLQHPDYLACNPGNAFHSI